MNYIKSGAKMYKISIIVPVFNSSEKLKKAFDSIYNQSIGFENLEVILIDDASTDGSQEIIKNYSEKYDNVQAIFLEENSGYAGKPRNIGIKNASAPYLMFLDSDDIYLDDACEILYNQIHESNIDMVSGNYIRYFGHKSHGKSWESLDLKDGEIIVDSISQQPEFFNVSQSVWCKIFKKDFILNNNIKFLEGVPAQDVYFVYDALLNADGIKYVDFPVVKYFPGDNINFNTVTSKRDKKSLLRYLKAYFEILSLFKNNKEYEIYIAPHLKFFTTQLIASEISNHDKMDLLRIAYPLYEIHSENNLKVKSVFTQFYSKVYEKKFSEALELIPYILPSLSEDDYKLYGDLKTKEYIIIYKHEESLLKLNNQLKNENYDVNLIDIEGIYDYYSQKFSDKNSEFQDNAYLTPDGFEFLTIYKDKVLFKDKLDGFSLEFENLNQFYEYYITELCLKNDGKSFLIIDDELDVKIDSSVAYIASNNSLDDWKYHFKELYRRDLMKFNKIILNEKKLLQRIHDLTGRNKRLFARKKQLEDINDDLRVKLGNARESRDYYKGIVNEMKESTSWKLTAPLRKIRNR